MSVADHATAAGRRPLTLLLLLIAGITVYRVAVALTHGLDLYVDEAQYWYWAQNLDWGYFSKPPMVALAILGTTGLCGDGEVCVRAFPLVAYPVTSLLIYAITVRLYDQRAAAWAALLFLTMPAIWLSTLVISTDVLLFLFWSAALLALLRALESDRWSDWLLVGLASGLGLQTKYTMGVFALSALLFCLLEAQQRRQLINPRAWAGAGLAALIFLPNLLWNIANDFPTVRHTASISNLDSGALHWGELLEFVAGQLAVFGPLTLLLFIAVALRSPGHDGTTTAATWSGGSVRRLLLSFSLPFLAIICLQALLGRANANWAAPAYVAASVLVAGELITATGRRADLRRRLLAVGIAINVAIGMLLYHRIELAGLIDAGPLAEVVDADALRSVDKRARGWDEFAAQVRPWLQRYPQATLLAEERDVLSELIYYLRPRAMDAVAWNPLGDLRSHYDLVTTMDDRLGEDFIVVMDRYDLADLEDSFASLEPLASIDVEARPGWRLRAQVYLARDFRGYR